MSWNAAARVLAAQCQSANITSIMMLIGLMSLKTRIRLGLAFLVLSGVIGFPSFSVCYGNGGNIVSCGLIGILVGAGKAILLFYLLIFALFADGFVHLHGVS